MFNQYSSIGHSDVNTKSAKMAKFLVGLWFYCVVICLPINGQDYQEKHRLQLHFSMPSGFANDPNGLVYYNGFYHLFYQYNPNSTITQIPVHWGHARSRDLIHWENLPIALAPYEKGDIFSGCCVVDEKNVSGIGTETPTLLAIYTLHTDVSQSQALAYSMDDDGITWTHYNGNPIIPNPGIADFRDPNIFTRNGNYFMALAVQDRIRFLTSTNLKNWQELSDFGMSPSEGDKSGVWECPSVVSLNDEQGNAHDILFVSENGDVKGSLLQYFVGTFNGITFKTYNATRVLWAENGYDNYAAVPYHNDPQGRVILLGWLSNWLYAHAIPTSSWRGQMTIPRQLGIKTIDGQIYLTQSPINEFFSLLDLNRTWSLDSPITLNGAQTVSFTSQIPFKTDSMLWLQYEIDTSKAMNGKIGLQFSNNLNESVSFYYNVNERTYEFDRRKSGNVTFNSRFANSVVQVNRIATTNSLTASIILDRASIEIFADNGLNTFSALFFPSEPFDNVTVISALQKSDESTIVQKLNITALNSIWSNSGHSLTPQLFIFSSLTSFWILWTIFRLNSMQ